MFREQLSIGAFTTMMENLTRENSLIDDTVLFSPRLVNLNKQVQCSCMMTILYKTYHKFQTFFRHASVSRTYPSKSVSQSVTLSDFQSLVATVTKEVDTIAKEVDTIVKEVVTVTKEVDTIGNFFSTSTKVYFPKVYFTIVFYSQSVYPQSLFLQSVFF